MREPGKGNPHIPGVRDNPGNGGYDEQQRSALDRLLDKQEKASPGTPI